jgi:hypothetical protein
VCELVEERGVLRGANDKQSGRGEGVRGLSARGGLGLGSSLRKRLGGLGGVLGTALWSQFSGVSAELGRVLCQRAEARVQ